MTPTAQDLIQWILANRKNKVFRGYTDSQITDCVLDALAENRILVEYSPYSDDDQQEITGCVIFRKTLKVEHLLTTRPGVFTRLVNLLHFCFPGFICVATRRGKLREYLNINQLLKKVNQQS